MPLKKREWVRSFEIGPATLSSSSKSKVVLYQVTSLIFPVGFPEAATKLVVRKKFSDFQQLHKALADIHKNLYLKGKFPVLPKFNKGYFKSSENADENEEKRKKCLELLEFSAEHPQLCNSRIFTDFFSEVDSPKSELELSSPHDETDRASSTTVDIFSALSTSANVVKTVDIIHKLASERHFLEAVALSTDLAPDPTPSLQPECLSSGTLPTAIDSSVPIPEKDLVKENSAEIVQKSNHPQSSDSDEIPEYLSDAANFISMAIQYESEENYDESVACYRNAIGTLLHSVQKDTCLKRQASVKRRISQYINKAENLIQLEKAAKSESKSPRKTANKIPHLDLFGNIRDLRLFKIQSILANKVLLVSETGNSRDNSSQQQVVIKALQKSSLVFKQRKTSMLPVNIPFMVRLLRYFETDEIIYLVLEYVPHGPLFPIVKPFLERLVSNNSDNLQSSASISRELSPFSTSSVIKPSASFVQLRRKSLQPDNAPRRRSRSTSIELDSSETRGETNLGDFLLRSQSLETEETSSVDDFNYVYTKDDATGENELFCIDNQGIEKISCNPPNNDDFDILKDSDNLNHQKLTNEPISIRVSSENDDSSKLVEDSKTLLSSLTAQLVSLKESKTAETILLEVEDIEKHVHLHLDGRALTPSPCRSFRALSGSPVSPPSTSSLNSSPPPVYAESEGDNDDLVLSDLVSTFDGVDLSAANALLPMELLRRWSTQLCHVIFALHSRGVVVQDLHPGNILLGSDLHLRLTYQCEWVSVDRAVNWESIEMLYSAPEVSDVGPLTPACDWWSVGAILYELLTGHRLVEVHPSGLLPHTPLYFPESRRLGVRERASETEMRSLVSALLQPVVSQRLGAGTSGPSDIKSHPFFKQVNWSLT